MKEAKRRQGTVLCLLLEVAKEAEEQRLVSFGKDFESDEKETKDRPLSPFERKQRCLSKYGNPAICFIPCRP